MNVDIAVVGGGLVGLSLACGLQSLGVQIAVIDATPANAEIKERYIALNDTSVGLLKRYAVWPALSTLAVPIEQVHVSKRGTFGATRLKASDVNLAALGYVIPASRIQQTLIAHCQTFANVHLQQGAVLKNLVTTDDQVQLTLQDGSVLRAPWVIGADGSHSTIRALLNIPLEKMPYQQSALITTLTLSTSHHNIAYERFLKQGAIAMLPLNHQQVASVWTDEHATVQHLMQLSEHDFLQALQQSFGYRLGCFQQVGQRALFPLEKITALDFKQGRVFLLGNALRTLHPIAAQGLNLAMLDVDQLVKHYRQWQSFSTMQLKSYRFNAELSDHLLWIFSQQGRIADFVRSAGLLSLDLIPYLKKRFLRSAIRR